MKSPIQKMLKHYAIITTLLIGALLTSCEQTLGDDEPLVRDPLVGKWEESSGKNWEYFSDGSVLMSQDDKDLNVMGKWSRLEDGRIKIEFTMLGHSVGEVFTEAVKGDDTSFTSSKGKVSHWKRVK
ncbi:hypothetical protein V2O64_24485 (plasmid) [Verrucomicrobiaceae bacterium 227]